MLNQFTPQDFSSDSNLPHHLRGLNPAQLAAVRHGEGPLLIFAGAGSGKTRVLTRRIANLVLEHRVPAESIFAVTFTNKAAQEMKERVHTTLSGISSNIHARTIPLHRLWVSTFHSSCARILREHAKCLDFTRNFAIYDTSDSHAVLKRVYAKLNIDPRLLEIRRVSSRIDQAKNQYKGPEDVRADRYIPEALAHMMADVFEGYQQELRSSNAMDFGDLLTNVVTLFKLEPAILERYQNNFPHLLIDEYQDTNRVQYLLVKMLAAKHQNLCVVGDDDQSIYAFRGATIENILSFKRDFPSAEVITLENNYRSTGNILEAANGVIAKNVNRQKKTMRTEKCAGDRVVCFHAFDEQDEATFVIREIVSLLKRGVSADDIAVFYRTNAQSRAVEELLCEHSIPYQIFGGHRFYDRKEIKDILAYFRLLLNPADNEAFLRIVNVPARGLGPTSVGALMAYATEKQLTLLPALRSALESKAQFLSTANRKKFSAFSELVAELEEEMMRAAELLRPDTENVLWGERLSALSSLLERIANRSGYLPDLKAQDTPEAESRVENLFELFEVAGEFVKKVFDNGGEPSLGDFLERASLISDSDAENKKEGEFQGPNTGSISLMTLHLAKGLEFTTVFLLGMEEGVLPHVRSLNERSALEEERRLCYVGITRAREKLFLSRASHRQTFGRGSHYSGDASRFLDDIPVGVLSTRWSELLGARDDR